MIGEEKISVGISSGSSHKMRGLVCKVNLRCIVEACGQKSPQLVSFLNSTVELFLKTYCSETNEPQNAFGNNMHKWTENRTG